MKLYEDIDFVELEKKIQQILGRNKMHIFKLLDSEEMSGSNEDGIRIAISSMINKGVLKFQNEELSLIEHAEQYRAAP